MKKSLLFTIFAFTASQYTFAMEKESTPQKETPDFFAQMPSEMHKEFIVNLFETPNAIENLKTLQKLMLTSKQKANLKNLFANLKNIADFCKALKNSTENIFRSLYLLRVYNFINDQQFNKLFEQFVKDFNDEFVSYQNDQKSFIDKFTKINTPFDLNILQQLINKGINVNAQTEGGNTALMMAAAQGSIEAVKLLLAASGIDVNSKNNQGFTALIWAARYGYDAVVKLLLAAPGINVNSQNNYRKTALILAASIGHDAVVKLLLAVPDIDVFIKDMGGNTALDLADTERTKDLLKAFILKKNEKLIEEAYLYFKEWSRKYLPFWRGK